MPEITELEHPHFDSYEEVVSAMNKISQLVVNRHPAPSGYAVTEERDYISGTHITKNAIPYWLLRDSQYASFDPMLEPCPLLANKRKRELVIRELAEGGKLLEPDAARFLNEEPEEHWLAISCLGRVATVTIHTHRAGYSEPSITTEPLETGEIINLKQAGLNAFTPDEVWGDFMKDLEQHHIYGKAQQPEVPAGWRARLGRLLGIGDAE